MINQFESAVITLFNEHDSSISQQSKNEAREFFRMLESSSEGLGIVCTKLLETSLFEVAFYCLKVLIEKIDSLSLEERIHVRSVLFKFIEKTYIKKEENIKKDEDVSIRNKVSMLYVKLLEKDYIDSWFTGFKDLMQLLNTNFELMSDNLVDIYFRILIIFDEEIVNTDNFNKTDLQKAKHTQIKDEMRVRDVGLLVDSFYFILSSFQSSSSFISEMSSSSASCSSDSLSSSLPVSKCISTNIKITEKNVSDCLNVISRFVIWIDIRLIANVEMLNLIFSFVKYKKNSSFCPNSSSSLACCKIRANAYECIRFIVSKRMHYTQKISMLKMLNIVDNVIYSVDESEDNEEIIEKLIETLCALAEDLIEVFCCANTQVNKLYNRGESFTTSNNNSNLNKSESDKSAVQYSDGSLIENCTIAIQSWECLENLLSFVIFKLFVKYNFLLAKKFEHLFSEFFIKIKSFVKSNFFPLQNLLKDLQLNVNVIYTERVSFICINVLQILLLKMEYPEWFLYENEDSENYEQFVEFRAELSKLFHRVVNVNDCIILDWIKSIVKNELCVHTEKLKDTQIEVILYIVYLIAEHNKDLQKELTSAELDMSVVTPSGSNSSDITSKSANSNASVLKTCFYVIIKNAYIMNYASHPRLLSTLMDLIIRFASFFQQQTSSLASVFEFLIGFKGIQNFQHPDISSKACNTLLKFIKINHAYIQTFVLHVIQALHPLLRIASDDTIQKSEMCEDYNVCLSGAACASSSSAGGAFPNLCQSSEVVSASSGVSVSCSQKPSSDRPPSELSFESKLLLYECVGILIGNVSACVKAASESGDNDGRHCAQDFSISNGGNSAFSLEQRKMALSVLLEQLTFPFEALKRKNEQNRSQAVDKLTKSSAFSDIAEDSANDFIFFKNKNSYYFYAQHILAASKLAKSFSNTSTLFFDQWHFALQSFFFAIPSLMVSYKVRESSIRLFRELMIFLGVDCLGIIGSLMNLFFNNNINDNLARNLYKENNNLVDRQEAEEFGEYITLLSHIVITFKNKACDSFLKPFFAGILKKQLEIWLSMSEDSVEMKRERSEFFNKICLLLAAVCTNCFYFFTNFLLNSNTNDNNNINNNKEEIVISTNCNEEKIQNVLIKFLLYGCSSKCLDVTSSLTASLSIYSQIFLFILDPQNNFDNTQQQAICSSLKLVNVIENCCEIFFKLDTQQPQHLRVLTEICNLFRLLMGKTKNIICEKNANFFKNFECLLLSIFINAMPIKDEQFAQQALHEICAEPTKENKEFLKNFIVSQQRNFIKAK